MQRRHFWTGWCLLGCLALASAGHGLELPWTILDDRDLPQLKERCVAILQEKQEVPVGLGCRGRSLTALLLPRVCVDAEKFNFYAHPDLDEVRASMPLLAKEGFFPYDLATRDGKVYVNWMATGLAFQDVFLIESGSDERSLNRTIRTRVAEGLIPMGLLIDGSRAWFSMMKTSATALADCELVTGGADDRGIARTIAQTTARKYLPMGFEIVGQKMFLLALKFRPREGTVAVSQATAPEAAAPPLPPTGETVGSADRVQPVSSAPTGKEVPLNGIWYDLGNRPVEIDLNAGTLRRSYGGQTWTYAITGRSRDGTTTILTATVAEAILNQPADYPEVLAQADEQAFAASAGCRVGTHRLRLVPTPTGSLVLSIQPPGATTWSPGEPLDRNPVD
ncbi:MAG: hypothetical protein GX442_09060 [Candidatus Riflebacteria bacterium]|nr:hypothetical protein [Candidatus Riflebacteria bacterium]